MPDASGDGSAAALAVALAPGCGVDEAPGELLDPAAGAVDVPPPLPPVTGDAVTTGTGPPPALPPLPTVAPPPHALSAPLARKNAQKTRAR